MLSTSPNASPAVDVGADGRDLDEHDVAEGVLGVVGDADPDDVPVAADPLVVGRVPELLGDVHGPQPYRNRRGGSRRRHGPRRPTGRDAGADLRDVGDRR